MVQALCAASFALWPRPAGSNGGRIRADCAGLHRRIRRPAADDGGAVRTAGAASRSLGGGQAIHDRPGAEQQFWRRFDLQPTDQPNLPDDAATDQLHVAAGQCGELFVLQWRQHDPADADLQWLRPGHQHLYVRARHARPGYGHRIDLSNVDGQRTAGLHAVEIFRTA